MAMKLLGKFASDQLRLIAALTASWSPLAGAPPGVKEEVKGLLGADADTHDPQCALEVRMSPLRASSSTSDIINRLLLRQSQNNSCHLLLCRVLSVIFTLDE